MPTNASESSDNGPKKEDVAKQDEDSDSDEEDNLEFNLFSAQSWDNQLLEQKRMQEKEEENKKNQGEAHLVDGELHFESEEHHGPKKSRNPNLVEGNTLPEDSGFPKEHYGKPIEEIDKLIRDKIGSKTFVVIAPRFKKEYIYRFSSTRSFFLLPPWNKFRQFLVYIATNQYFDYFIILTILTNCIFLAMPDVPASEQAEFVFLAIYSLEMILKIFARGFIINSYTYLRDAWNWLDFLVIISAYFTVILDFAASGADFGNLQGIRTFRVFRVLRTVSIVPGLKTIVNALLRAFRMLFEVMMLIMFCLMVFALFGLQIYMGVLRQKCVTEVPAYNGTVSYSYAQYWNDYTKNSSNWYGDGDGGFAICGNATGSQSCPSSYTCLPDIGENPNFGYTGFDHFGWAMLTSFQLITLDFWEDSYNKILQSSGPWNIIFFIFVIFFGSFYLLNLMLAVVAMSYEEEAESAGKEKEKEARNKNKKKKKKKKLQEKQEKMEKEKAEQDAKDKADNMDNVMTGTTNAVKAAVEIGYPSAHAKLAMSSTTRPLGTQGMQQQDGKDRKHVQRRPMVKMPSKDSGTGNSVESSRSNGSKDGDFLIHEDGSYNGSTLEMAKNKQAFNKKPLLKQASSGMVSSSGVTLTHDRGYKDNIEEDLYNELEEQNSEDGKDEFKSSVGRDYIADKYTDIVIIDVEDNYDMAPENGQLVNRNCDCCYNCCWGRAFVPWLRIQSIFYIIASEPLFDLFITICISLNTILMATEHHNMSETLTQTLKISNYVFTSIFTFEAIVKITAFTKHYFKIGWNIFDLVIVIASLVDLGLEDIDGLSVFRAFRLLRVFKLAQSWPTMKLLLSIIMNTLGALGNLTLILCIVIYIFAVIGLQLFNKSYTSEVFGDDIPRWNFNDIFHAFMMIFRVLCGEWIEPLWDCMQAADELCMAVFIPTLILGYFIVLNLFLALLLNAFATDSLQEAKGKGEEENKLKVAFKRLYELVTCCVKKNPRVNSVEPADLDEEGGEADETSKKNGLEQPVLGNGTDKNAKHLNGVTKDKDGKDSKNVDDAFTTKRDQYTDFNKALAESKNNKNGVVEPAESKEGEEEEKDAKNEPTGVRIYTIPKKPKPVKKGDKNQVGAVVMPKKDPDELELGAEASNIKKDKKDGDKDEEEDDKKIEVYDCIPLQLTRYCACYFACDGKRLGEIWFMIRVYMNMVVSHKAFESLILFLIGASSISLAFEDVNLYSKPEMVAALQWLNIIFVVLFTLEMLMKWIAFGLKAYFTNFWCILDFTIVAVSLASLIADAYGGASLSAFRSLRTLRALRPLRAISRWQGMRIVVNALMMAIPSIVNVLVVCFVFWLIFSIMGVQFFAGKFYKCVDSSGERLAASVVPNRAVCENNASQALGYKWENSKINFDHVGSGYLALFQVATFEGWMEVMIDAVDSTEVDEQPDFEKNLYSYLYFVAFIIFGAFFTLNLFIGVIIDNFNMLKKKYDGSYLDMFLTSGQRQYYNTIKKLGNKKPQKTIKRPKNKFQAIFYDISNSSKFELCIVVVIFLNMITMAVAHHHQTEMVTDVLNMLNILFVVVFSLEAFVKIIGLRWHYFRMAWNVFDFIVVLLSLLGIIIEDVISSVIISPTLLRVVRVFRIGRVLRLIKAAKGIRKLLFALIISLPALLNIGMLLFLIMYIYAIICLSTFQNLKINGALDDDVVNFKTFINSFMLMFRLSTAAGWNDILDSLLLEPPDCDPDYFTRPDGQRVKESPGDCGTPYMAVLALTTYILVIFLVVINMFIAVILENFNQAHEQEEVGITEDDFDMFYVVWERYDPLATQFIKYEQLSNFVADLEPPLGISKPNEIALVSFDLPIVEGDKLHCLDVLMALVKYVLGNVEESPEFNTLHEQVEQRFQAAFPTRVNTCRTSSTMARKKEDVAAKTLQRAWRSWKAQKQMKNIAALAMQHQNQKKVVNVESRGKANSIRNLGTRLSTALSTFFSSSRPSSAISRLSVKSDSPSTSDVKPTTKKRGKVQSAMEMPKVSVLYSPEKDNDIEL